MHIVHADFLERPQRIRILDPLGNAAHTEVPSKGDDRLDDRRVGRMLAHRANELAVNLQGVGRQILQILERGVTRTEVVERDLAAHIMDARNEPLRVLQIVQRNALGDFEAQVTDDGTVARKQREDVFHELLVVERAAAQVDAHKTRLRQSMPVRLDPFEYCGEHPPVDAGNVAGLLRRHDHLAGRQYRAVRGTPAKQHFEVERIGRCGERHDWLHHEEQPTWQAVLTQRLDQHEFLGPFLERRRTLVISDEMPMRHAFCLTARAIRVGQRVLHPHAVRALHEANRRLHLKRAISDLIRGSAEQGDEFAALRDRVLDQGVAHHADEFVATDAPHRVFGPEQRSGTR